MAKVLKYKFDKVHLKRSTYVPKGHADIKFEQNFIRRCLVELFLERKAIPIKIINPVEQTGTSETKEENKA